MGLPVGISNMRLPRTEKGQRFYPTYKYTQLACCNFMYTGRRHETPESEGKGSLLFIVTEVTRVLPFAAIFQALIFTGEHKDGKVAYVHAAGYIIREEL